MPSTVYALQTKSGDEPSPSLKTFIWDGEAIVQQSDLREVIAAVRAAISYRKRSRQVQAAIERLELAMDQWTDDDELARRAAVPPVILPVPVQPIIQPTILKGTDVA